MEKVEYTAIEIRKCLQRLFPTRKLVLSQFTFFNQIGVAKATGENIKRGRRCYRFSDVLSIAAVIALKEAGIPLKNIVNVPSLIQENAHKVLTQQVLAAKTFCKLCGFKNTVVLKLPDDSQTSNLAIDNFLNSSYGQGTSLFWSFDLGLLARQLSWAFGPAEGELVRQAA